jgi:hypothetical protein
MKRLFTVLVVVIIMSGCATHKSPLQSSDKFIFVTADEEGVFQAAYDAMLEGRRESPIADINGPIRGYVLTRKWGLDYWTSMIRVFPAEGRTDAGEIVRGYYPEVSGEGTLIIRGPAMDETIYEAAVKKFGEVGQKVSVVSIERGDYLLKRDAFRLHEKPSLRDGGTIKIEGLDAQEPKTSSIEHRLQELENLRLKKMITEDEYQKARKQILEDI